MRDTKAPEFVNFPPDVTVECDEVPERKDPDLDDNCDAAPSLRFEEQRVDGSCNDSYVLTRKWTTSDACGNTRTAIQSITVEDNKAPEFTFVPVDVTVACSEVPAVGQPTAEDNCKGMVSFEFDERREDGSCDNEYTLTREWTASDDCGNTKKATQIITVVDRMAPVFEFVPLNTTVQCDEVPAPGQPTASDNCAGTVSFEFAERRIDGNCEYNYTLIRTWTASDICGNTATATQEIVVEDTKVPTLNGVPADTSVECDEVPAPATVTAEDNCAENLTVSFDEAREDGTCDYDYKLIRTWMVEDVCGNRTSAQQVIEVKDTKAPELNGVPADTVVECDEVPTPATVTAEDNCDDNLTVVFDEFREDGACAYEYTLRRVWTVTDQCGNSNSDEQIITVQDNKKPVLIGVPADTEVACDEVPSVPTVTAEDNCDALPRVEFAEKRIDGNCEDRYTLERRWTATDACGNKTERTQTIVVKDDKQPRLIGVPANTVVECDEVPAPVTVTAEDECDPNVPVEFSERRIDGNCAYNYTLIRSWIATDRCGNRTSATQEITVQDTRSPVASNVPVNTVVNCNEVPAVQAPVFEDACDANLATSFDEKRTDGNCAFNYTLTRTWIATDACGNSEKVVQVIEVEDVTAPQLSAGPADTTVECDEVPAPAVLTATDECDLNATVEFAEKREDGSCINNYTLIRTWTASDVCGNSAQHVQRIEVQDTKRPVFFDIPVDTVVECDEVPERKDPKVEDNCDENIELLFDEIREDGDCEFNYTLTRTWVAMDRCGNRETAQQVITVRDTKAPELKGVPADTVVECDEVPAPALVTASDNCVAEVEVLFDEVREDGDCDNSYTLIRTWSAEDRCGNAVSGQQVITVQDTKKPQLIGVPVNTTAECDEVPAAVEVTAEDNCDPNVTVEFRELREDGACDFQYTLTRIWIAKDQCGNRAEARQVIEVRDTKAPQITNVPVDTEAACDEVPAPATPTVTDNCDEEVRTAFSEKRIDGQCDFAYTLIRTWTATDRCGNSSTATQEIVVKDNKAPIFEDVPADTEVECDEVPAVYEVTASDNCSEEVTIRFRENSLPGDCPYSYTLIREWEAIDACGNKDKYKQTIVVRDTKAPELSGVPVSTEASCDEVPPMPAAGTVKATDNCDATPRIQFDEKREDGNCPNSYTLYRTWTATDACGNSSQQTQVISISDSRAPQFSGLPVDTEVECDEVPAPALVTAEDDCDGTVEVQFSEQRIDGDCDYSYTIKRSWLTQDACGNEAKHIQTIEVRDSKAPELEGVPADTEVSCLEVPAPATVTVSDNCDATVELDFNEEKVEGDCATSYTLIRIWSATDQCGNTTEKRQRIEVIDEVKPVLVGVPVSTEAECDEVPAPANVTATDECGGTATVAFAEARADGDCANNYTLIRTWTATDDCGNETTASQEIVVRDTKKPVLNNVPVDTEVSCDEVPASPMVTAEDNCDGALEVKFDESRIDGDCANSYTLTRTWTAIDQCGNEASAKQVIYVSDNSRPQLLNVPANTSVQCGELPEVPEVTAEDSCAEGLEVDFREERMGDDDCDYQLIRIWTVVDACGNEQSAQQVITVKDTKAPVLSNVPVSLSVDLTRGETLPAVANVTASDVCSGDLVPEFQEVAVPVGNDGCTREIRRTWKATDNCGNVKTARQTITVIDYAVVTIEAAKLELCVGESIGLSANTNVTAAQYEWSTDGGALSATSGASVSFSAVEPGDYTVDVKVNSAICTGSASIRLVVSEAPKVNAENNGPVCEGQSVQLSVPEGGDSYSWEGPNGFTSDQRTPVIEAVSAATAGVYTVKVNYGGCVSEATTTVEIGRDFKVNLDSNSPVCDGDDIELSVDAGVSFSWTGPNGFTSDEAAISIKGVNLLDHSGLYTVTVVNEDGCQRVLETYVEVIRPSAVHTASNGPVCYDETLELYGDGGVEYFWEGPNGYTSNEQFPVIEDVSIFGVGTHTFTLTTTNLDDCNNSATIDVEILGGAEVELGSELSVCPGESVTLDLAGTGELTFQWEGPNGFTSTERNPVIDALDAEDYGIYTVVAHPVSFITTTV
ncbi:MAG: hypothetical protein AAFO94_00930 [Bacteroidota bacterium]